MPTPQEHCQAKRRVTGNTGSCEFGKPNALNPAVQFSGCPACHRASDTNVTLAETEADMRALMAKIKKAR